MSTRLNRFLLANIILILLAGSFIAGLADPAVVYAANIIVNSTADTTTNGDGECTLREALQNASSSGDTTGGDCLAGEVGLDTITFNLPPNSTITLNSQLPNITNEVTIDGSGVDNLTISGNNSTRILAISSGAVGILNDLTLSNGKSPTGVRGGAIYNNGILTLNSVIVTNSETTNEPGGGIYNHNSGILTLQDSTVSDNKTGDIASGGGICNYGTMTLRNSTVTRNATPAAGGIGGGIRNTGTLSILSGSVISYNQSNDGGGIYNSGSVVIENSVVHDNQGNNGGGIGNSGSVTISHSTIRDNQADETAAGIGNQGTLVMSYSTVSGNQVTGSSDPKGGGIYNIQGGKATIENSTISGNQANKGAGIYNGDFDSTNDTTVTLTNVTVANNNGSIGAGIRNYKGSSATVVTFIKNSLIVSNGSSTCANRNGGQMDSSPGYNLTDDATCISGGTGNIITTSPGLGPLQDNGGSTKTHALLTGSPAVNAGTNAGVTTTDQRGPGFPRLLNGTVDIGAYESNLWPSSVVEFSQDAPYQIHEDGSLIGPSLSLSRTGSGVAEVQVSITAGSATGGTVSPPADFDNTDFPLTVTFADGDLTKTIPVTIFQDIINEGRETITFTVTAVSSATIGTNNTATVQIMDDDTAGVTVNPVAGLTTTEAGGMANFDIVLATQPTDVVTITLNSLDSTEGMVSPTVISFTTTNWDTPQTIVVTGVDDTTIDGDVGYTIQLNPAVSNDPAYAGYDPPDVTLTNLNDDLPPPNQAPIAHNDYLTVLEDTPTVLSILNNDYDPDGYILPQSINIINQPTFGTLTVNALGGVQYTPNLNFNGQDSFSYQVTDNSGAVSNITGVSLTVTPVNDPPTMTLTIGDQTTLEDNLFEFTLPVSLCTDVDPNDSLTFTAALSDGASLPTWLQFDPASHTFSGTPTNDDLGPLEIQVTATDSAQASVSTSFTVTVINLNDPPILLQPMTDQLATEDNPFNFIVATDTFTDIDPGDQLTYHAALSGTASLPDWLSFNPLTAEFSGTPTNDEVGQWVVTLTAKDLALACTTTQFTLTVINLNDAPVAQVDIARTPEETPLTVSVLDNDYDVDEGDILSLVTVSPATTGQAVISGTTVLYTPPVQYNGVVTFSYTIADTSGETATAEVIVVVGDPNLIARSDTAQTNEDQAVTIEVLANDTNTGSQHNELSLLTVGAANHGQTAINGTSVIYTPAANFNGLDTFVYIVTNGEVADIGVVMVTVEPVNDNLVARNDEATTLEELPVAIEVLLNDRDQEGDALTIQTVSTPQRGLALISNTAIIYIPAEGFYGVDHFTYTVTDGEFTATATVTVDVLSFGVPVAVADVMTTTTNTPVAIDVLANDQLVSQSELQVITIGVPRYGEAMLSGTIIIYIPPANFVGQDWLDYTVSNGDSTDMALVSINVISHTRQSLDLTAGSPVTLPLPAVGQLTVTLAHSPTHGTIIINETNLVYLSTSGFSGTESFTYTIDNGLTTEWVTIVVEVTADTQPPTFPVIDGSSEVVLLAPIHHEIVTSPRPVFQWLPAIDNVGVSHYTLVITPLELFTSANIQAASAHSPFIYNASQLSFTPPADLPPGSYHWTIMAHDAAGNISRPLSPADFVVPSMAKTEIFLPLISR